MPQSNKGSDKPKGLKVEIVLWHLERRKRDFKSKDARLWIRGDIKNINGPNSGPKKFNDAGELLTILGKWNAAKLRAFRKKK
ncbi:MAG TPA: hypothetical protein VJN89_21735 [Candidatus Acidoferrum sp.]|nr:hypothetical protein [Candidatus Acidoferrum sp.]